MRLEVISIGLLWAAIPFTHLLDLGYTFFSFEVWAMSALFMLAGSALAYVFGSIGLQSLLAASTLFLLISLYFFDTAKAPTYSVIALFGALFLLHVRLGGKYLPIAGTFAVFFSLSNALVPNANPFDHPTSQAPSSGEPKAALVHIILDEQGSLDAMAHTIPPKHPALSMYNDYEARGFKVYRTLRSVTDSTLRSLTNLVSLSNKTENYQGVRNQPSGLYGIRFEVIQNAQIENLVSQEYRVRVFQSIYLNFCAPVQKIDCRTFPIQEMSVFQSSRLSLKSRLLIAFWAMSHDYAKPKNNHYVAPYRAVADRLFPERRDFRFLSWPLTTLGVIDQMEMDLQDIQPGDVYIAHLLLPHWPFLLNTDCKLNPPHQWAVPISVGANQDEKDIFKSYWDQAVCTHKKLLEIIDSLEDKPYVQFMIHGDHGSRFHNGTDDAAEADKKDTFFAIKGPSPLQVQDTTDLSLQEVFKLEFNHFLNSNQ